MKLDIETLNHSSSEELKAMDFGISDPGMLFEMLRSKMYSDPISSICREISCNSRDAHREVGKFDLPIEITVPTLISPVIKFKDWGPGIDPSRMEDIFIKYCASTKRGDNIQTGGFGTGSKVGFSYSDTFSVETIVDGIKYFYTAMIDDTRVGKMYPVSQEPTTESNGTTIIIPIRKEHYQTFLTAVIETTKYWDVRPIIKGTESDTNIDPNKNLRVLLSGNDWEVFVAISDENRSGGRYNYNTHQYVYDDQCIALIDGIPYKVQSAKLDSQNKIIENLCEKNVRIRFGIGELSLSSSREEHFDEKTKKKIIARLLEVSDAIAEDLSNQVETASNLSEAEAIYYEVSNKMKGTYKATSVLWNGMALKGLRRTYASKQGIETPSITHLSIHKSYRSSVASLRRDHRNTLDINKNSPIYINDVKKSEAPYKIIREIIENDSTVESVQLITADQATLDYMNECMDLKFLETNKLSEGPRPAKKPRDNSNKDKIDAWKFNTNYKSGANVNWEPANFLKGEIGTSCNHLYVVCEDKRSGTFSSEGMTYVDEDIRCIKNFLGSGENIYAVKSEKKLGSGWAKLTSFVKDEFNKKLNGRALEEIHEEIVSNNFSFESKMESLVHLINVKNTIKHTHSVMLDYIEASKNLSTSIEDNKKLLIVGKLLSGEKYKSFVCDEKSLSIAKLYNKVLATYPMLQYAVGYYVASHQVVVSSVVDYINLVDDVEAAKKAFVPKLCANA